MKNFIKKYKFVLILLIITIIFFSSSLIITFDSSHYLGYVDIFEGNKPFATWDVVRGPIFPLILYLFDLVFGKSSYGMLLGMFSFYLIYCLIVYKFAVTLFKDTKHKNIYTFLLCAFSWLNPVILGYYHTMLTEFVALTITFITLIVSWKWWNTEKHKLLYSLYFIVFITVSYFLKQPYLCTVFIPMTIAVIYAIIKNHTKKNILYYAGTFVVAMLVLLIAMPTWNAFLEHKGVNLDSGRDSSSMLTKQLLNSIDAYRVDIVDKYAQVKNDKYLTKKEKKAIKKEISKKRNVYIISIYKKKKLLEKDYLVVEEGEYPSGKDTVIEIVSTFFKHPGIIVKQHAKNYCALSSVCLIESEDGVMYHVTNKLDVLHMFENNVIPFKSFKDEEKYFYFPEERYETVKNYLVPRNQGLISKVMTKTFMPVTLVFEFVILTVGLFLIALLGFRIKKRKKLKGYNMYLFSFMMLAFSFSTLLINDWVGSIIDRYAVICFIPGLIGILGTFKFIHSNIGSR